MKNESLIKSRKRVKDFGEVYTPPRIVKEMCDLVPQWSLEQTFLEPACGNGNFLVEVLKRKLAMCANADDIRIAVCSIYGVDLLSDNVREAKARMYEMIRNAGVSFDAEEILLVLNLNVQQGDFLMKTKANGKPLIFVDWRKLGWI